METAGEVGRKGEGEGLNIGGKLCVAWDINSRGLKEGKDLNPLFSTQKQSLATS